MTIDFLYQSARTVVLALTVAICAVFAAFIVADDVEDLISKKLINIRFDMAAQLANPQVWDFAAITGDQHSCGAATAAPAATGQQRRAHLGACGRRGSRRHRHAYWPPAAVEPVALPGR